MTAAALAAPPAIPRITAPALRRALIAGSRRVIARRELLNRINVFPVPDGDTGSNLAFTLGSVLAGALSRRSHHAGELLARVGSDAIDGARGNSGAILASFLQGAAEAVGTASTLGADAVAGAVRAGAQAARAALSEPREGTILSVIQAFAEALESGATGADLGAWFEVALVRARRALARTPEQLPVLQKAGVVDAGAQGFVDLLEGIAEYLATGRLAAAPAQLDAGADLEVAQGHRELAEGDPAHRYCTECLVLAEVPAHPALDRAALRAAVAALDASCVVLAGSAQRARLHAHVADPRTLFETCARFGRVEGCKADDMLAQRRAAAGAGAVAIVTDSAADLPLDVIERYNIHVVPVRVSFGARDFLDKIGLSTAEFYRLLRNEPMLPQTSQPPPGDFRRQFEFLLSHHAQVAYVGLSRALSGTLQSGETAAARSDAERVRVFDSGNAAGGQALLALRAAELAEAGLDVDAIGADLARLKPLTLTFAIARDIRHGVRGGRVPAWARPVIEGLGLTPVAKIRTDGRLGIAGALWGRTRAPERFAAYIARRLPRARRWRLIVGHCDAAADGADLLAALRRRLDVDEGWLVETGPAIGAHAGPGALVASLQPVE